MEHDVPFLNIINGITTMETNELEKTVDQLEQEVIDELNLEYCAEHHCTNEIMRNVEY